MGFQAKTQAKKISIELPPCSIGTCLAAMSSTFPVAFLEPALNKFNPHSVMGSGFAQKSLEAQEVVARLEQCVPNLEAQLQEVDKFVGEAKDHSGEAD